MDLRSNELYFGRCTKRVLQVCCGGKRAFLTSCLLSRWAILAFLMLTTHPVEGENTRTELDPFSCEYNRHANSLLVAEATLNISRSQMLGHYVWVFNETDSSVI